MRVFKSEEHRQQRAVLLYYKIHRRRGMQRAAAVEKARERAARMFAMVAVMDASGWTANPVLIAAQAHAAV